MATQRTIGLIVLQSDLNVLAQHRLMLPDDLRIEAEPIELKDGVVTAASLAAMVDSDQIERAAARLSERGAARIVFCCTSGSLIHGVGWDRTLVDRIEQASGVPGSTTTSAVLAAFDAVGARTIAIGTPYLPEIDRRERSFFEQMGFSVAAIEGLGCPTDAEIGALPPDTLVALAERVDRPDADLVFLSCTSLNVAERIDEIEQRIGKPVVTSNQATAWHLLNDLGIAPAPDRFGRLMSRSRASVA